MVKHQVKVHVQFDSLEDEWQKAAPGLVSQSHSSLFLLKNVFSRAGPLTGSSAIS